MLTFEMHHVGSHDHGRYTEVKCIFLSMHICFCNCMERMVPFPKKKLQFNLSFETYYVEHWFPYLDIFRVVHHTGLFFSLFLQVWKCKDRYVQTQEKHWRCPLLGRILTLLRPTDQQYQRNISSIDVYNFLLDSDIASFPQVMFKFQILLEGSLAP